VLKPLKGSWNVINCFADNTTSQKNPDLVATRRGEKAVRGTASRFLWDWICPSQPEYRQYCKNIIRKVADNDIAGIRLDSVCFTREGFCDCRVCTQAHENSGLSWADWRASQIESFVKEVREIVPENLGLTIEPDPCCGRERFGLDLEALSRYVDFFSIPLYMHYSIVYWVDILAYCFRRRIKNPLFIEIYAGHPEQPTRSIFAALVAASPYADCLVLSTFDEATTKKIQREMTTDRRIWKYADDRNAHGLLEILEKWEGLS